MRRLLTVLSAVLCAVIALAAPLRAHAAVALNPTITVTGNTIRLGDFFAGAGNEAQVTVAAAPALGMRATYSSAWLAALARQYHLGWKPASDFDQASVVRASRYIDADTIAARLLEVLGSSAGDGTPEIHFDNPALRLLVPAEADDRIAVDGLSFDRRTGRFSAYVVAPPDSANAKRLRVAGRLIVDVDVAVPNHAIAANEVLKPGDIEHVKLPRERLALDTLTDASQLIGKSAIHVLRADQPVRAGDVQDPLVVRRGDLVTIELRTPTMELSAQGKALEDGAMGARIRVANTRSKRAVDAVVVGADLVSAVPPQRYAER
jgi:flagellar basal body P-ring formation protein FlgA